MVSTQHRVKEYCARQAVHDQLNHSREEVRLEELTVGQNIAEAVSVMKSDFVDSLGGRRCCALQL